MNYKNLTSYPVVVAASALLLSTFVLVNSVNACPMRVTITNSSDSQSTLEVKRLKSKNAILLGEMFSKVESVF